MEQAAIEQGIPADLARLLARQTVSGSGALLAASAEDAAELRRAVTSPGGTTERALAVLMAAEAWPAASQPGDRRGDGAFARIGGLDAGAATAPQVHAPAMDDAEFDSALIAAAFQMAAEQGWRRVSVAAAARAAGLPLARARARFPGRAAILLRFGRLADQAALAEAPSRRAGARPAVRPADAAHRRVAGASRRRAGAAARLARRAADRAAAGARHAAQHALDAGSRRHPHRRHPRRTAGEGPAWRSGSGRCAPGARTTTRICRRPWRRSMRRCAAPSRRPAGLAGARARGGSAAGTGERKQTPPEETPPDAPA